ncbi:MAG: phosphoribosylglycinamide formyltransferase [Balneolaceae bacterium]|nr:phosphoribosylglycinamide formyltransferase [Balneolaceae bacterium]
MKHIVVFASGSGSNFQAIIDAIEAGQIKDAIIAGLIAGKPGIQAIERAEKAGIPVEILDSSASGEQADQQITGKLADWKPDLIVLAGYLKKIPDSVVKEFDRKMINIHPSLLPKFGGKGYYGSKVHSAVLEAGERESGCTVHFVNEQYDQGSIIRQVRVPVLADDTVESLSKRVLEKEHELLPAVINELLNSNSD